jgi:hypothetical protein
MGGVMSSIFGKENSPQNNYRATAPVNSFQATAPTNNFVAKPADLALA